MVKRTRFTLGILAAAATLVAAVPPVGASANGLATYCYGGDDDPYSYRLPLSDDLFMSWDDGTVWQDTNGVPGIQREARECYVVDKNYRVVDSYVEYTADKRVA